MARITITIMDPADAPSDAPPLNAGPDEVPVLVSMQSEGTGGEMTPAMTMALVALAALAEPSTRVEQVNAGPREWVI